MFGAFNFDQEKALVGAFYVIVQLHRLIDLRHYTLYPDLIKCATIHCAAFRNISGVQAGDFHTDNSYLRSQLRSTFKFAGSTLTSFRILHSFIVSQQRSAQFKVYSVCSGAAAMWWYFIIAADCWAGGWWRLGPGCIIHYSLLSKLIAGEQQSGSRGAAAGSMALGRKLVCPGPGCADHFTPICGAGSWSCHRPPPLSRIQAY